MSGEENTLKVKIQNRRSTSAEWESQNPLLLDGEIAIVRDGDETRLKVGDGINNYNDLPFIDEHLRNILSNEITIDLNGAVIDSAIYEDGAWSRTELVDSDNSDISKYVTRVSLSDMNKEDKNPNVLFRDINGFEYKGSKRIESENIYFYSNGALPGCLIIEFGSIEKNIDIATDISDVLEEGKWSLTSVVDSDNSGIAKYVTKISLTSLSSNKKTPQIFIKGEDNFIIDINKRIGFDYAYLYSNEVVSGKIIIII